MSDSPSVTEREKVLAQRKAFIGGAWWLRARTTSGAWDEQAAAEAAINCYPLPVRRVPREEPDPEDPGIRWRVAEGRLEHRMDGKYWSQPDDAWLRSPNHMRARLALWASLFETPDREVSE